MDTHMQSAPALAGQVRGEAAPRSVSSSDALWKLLGVDMVALLRRKAWWIVAGAIVGGLCAYIYAATLPKSFTADSTIAVEGDRVDIPELQGVLRSDGSPDPMPLVHTEAQALGARQLLFALVDELHLDRDPEFNAALRPPTLVGRLIGTIKAILPSPHAPAVANGIDDSVVNAVGHALSISQDNRSLVIGLSFTAHDPRVAAAVVNRLIADYMAGRTKRRADANLGANTAITQRIDEVRADIEGLERQMQHLRQTSGIVSLRAGSVGQQQIEDLTNEAEQAAMQRSQIQANLSRASAAASSGSSEELATVLGSETISHLREQESEASSRVADLSARFGPNYPSLQSAHADLSAVRGQLGGEAHRIVASLGTQLKAAQQHEADIDAQLQRARTAGAAAQDVQAQLEQLQQDVTTRRTLYSTLLERAQQTVSQPHGDALPDVRVLSAATPPGLPSAPNMKLASGLGGSAGVLVVVLAAFVRVGGHTRFNDAADVACATGATILAELHGTRWDRLAAPVALKGPNADALRMALARLRGTGGGYPARVVGFISFQPGRQASAAVTAFARIAASSGQSVLLIEADGGKHDLVSVLHPGGRQPVAASAGDLGWRDSVMRDTVSPLDLLIGHGGEADATQQVVAQENLLVEAREEYDLILLGAPIADDLMAMGLARSCDLMVFVVDTSVASPAMTRAACARLYPLSRSRPGVIILGAA